MPRIFISCGQRNEAETQLANGISDLVTEITPFEPYFAGEQTTLEGLTSHILQALYDSVGLIVVLHERGNVTPPDDFIRASVWVEQEIAITAFITQVLGRKFYIQSFIQPRVSLEGIREQLLLNPKPFETDDDVLEHLRQVLPTWELQEDLEGQIPEQAEPSLDVLINYEEVQIQAERHDYRLIVSLNNRTNDRIERFVVECEFPANLCQPHMNEYYVQDRSNANRALFRVTDRELDVPIFPRDTIRVLTVDYFIDTDIFMNQRGLFQQRAIVTVYTNDEEPMIVEKPIAQLQIF